MPFKGGVKEAAKMLAGLDKSSRENVLKKISQVDPAMAESLKMNMVDFEDLKYMTQKMLIDFLKRINLNDLGLALRGSSEELRAFFLSNVSSGMKQDIMDHLKGPPQMLSKVQEAQMKIMDIAKEMEEKGEIILSRDDEMV
jgi:flagellar motor switch protein FliG